MNELKVREVSGVAEAVVGNSKEIDLMKAFLPFVVVHGIGVAELVLLFCPDAREILCFFEKLFPFCLKLRYRGEGLTLIKTAELFGIVREYWSSSCRSGQYV
jgi:hypothetical protein